MAKEQRHTPEQVIGKLRETEVELASVRDAEVDGSEAAMGDQIDARRASLKGVVRVQLLPGLGLA